MILSKKQFIEEIIFIFYGEVKAEKLIEIRNNELIFIQSHVEIRFIHSGKAINNSAKL
jgi:hypothetical protein